MENKLKKQSKFLFHRKHCDETKEKRTVAQKIAIGIAFALFLAYAITLLYPFLYIIINSFKNTAEFTTNFNGLPKSFTFSNYASAFSYRTPTSRYSIPEMFLVSVMLSVGGTVLTVLFSSMTAYVMAKYKFAGKEVIYTIVIISLIVPIVGTFLRTLLIIYAVDFLKALSFLGFLSKRSAPSAS